MPAMVFSSLFGMYFSSSCRELLGQSVIPSHGSKQIKKCSVREKQLNVDKTNEPKSRRW